MCTTNNPFKWNYSLEIIALVVHVLPHWQGVETFSLMCLLSAITLTAILWSVQLFNQAGICLVSFVKSVALNL